MSQLAVPVTTKDHTDGPSNAPITLVEYGDYQCPSCGEVQPLIHKLQKHFGDKLRFVFRHFPLEMHEHAEHAAVAAEFAASHHEFWSMHALLFKHQADLKDAELLKLAKQLSLPEEELAAALEDGTFAAPIEASLKGGIKSGVEGTPSFYVNGKLYEDAYDFDAFVEALDTSF